MQSKPDLRASVGLQFLCKDWSHRVLRRWGDPEAMLWAAQLCGAVTKRSIT